jgi:hypothetical protein
MNFEVEFTPFKEPVLMDFEVEFTPFKGSYDLTTYLCV